MQKTKLTFPNVSTMAYFIMTLKSSDFTEDWPNASMVAEMDDSVVKTACTVYNAISDEVQSNDFEVSAAV